MYKAILWQRAYTGGKHERLSVLSSLRVESHDGRAAMSGRKPITTDPGNRPVHFTVHQLTVFRTVAQHLSYTRAAEALYLSQPAVAQQIKTLEQVLGLRLFERLG